MMSEEVYMNVENEKDVGFKVEHVDCSDAFKTSQLLVSHDEVLQWARSLAHDIGFVVVIMRSDTNIGVRGRVSFLLIACEMSGEYRPKKHNLFRGLFMKVDTLPEVIVTDRDLSLINAVKTVFPDATNLLCWFHIDKNVKAKCKTLVDNAHWSLKRLLQNSLGDICSVWEAMNNMMALQHTQIKASFETSTHVVGHMFKVILYKKLLGMVSRYTLNEIVAEYERVPYAGKNPSRCGYVMRSTHGLPCACELYKYVVSFIPLETIHIFWWRLSFSDQGLCETQVTISEEMKTISKRFEQLNVCGKVRVKSKLREIAYPDVNSMCPPLEKVKSKEAPKKPLTKQQKSTKRDPSYWEYVDAYTLCKIVILQ
ncbi:hypothetical protein GmHk_14G041962 [Glycine max]|nr:hypothetical protein GmHk_14G041962 [Glycine max]